MLVGDTVLDMGAVEEAKGKREKKKEYLWYQGVLIA